MTRAKKIVVQATQNFGKRFKGELFSVAEGHMRLKLHPEGLAVYVLKDQPLKFKEITPVEAQQKRQEIAQLLRIEKQKELEQTAKNAENVVSAEDKQEKAVKSLLSGLNFPKAGEQIKEQIKAQPTEQGAQPTEQGAQNVTPGQGKKFAWQSKFVSDMTEK